MRVTVGDAIPPEKAVRRTAKQRRMVRGPFVRGQAALRERLQDRHRALKPHLLTALPTDFSLVGHWTRSAVTGPRNPRSGR